MITLSRTLTVFNKKNYLSVLIIAVLFLLVNACRADSYDVLEGHEDEPVVKGSKFIPYGFYNESTELAVAGTYFAQGYIQPQVNIVTNVFYSTNNSYNFFYYIADLQMPFNDRIFLDVIGFNSEWGELDSYRDGNPAFADERAGSNDSDKDNFIQSEGSDNLFRLDFRYLLPIGHAKGKPIHQYIVEKNGLLVSGSESGGDSWNPFSSGRTFLEFKLFNREQDLEDNAKNRVQLKTTAFTLGLEYDNTDYWRNPSRGSKQSILVSRDWGMNDEEGAQWTTIEAEYSKFFSLGESSSAYQRVIAFNAWWIDTPTWDDSSTHNGKEIYHRPPTYQGATLGGLDRQRAFPAARFNDRSAVNYALEYRHMNKWNPFLNIPLIKTLRIPWWQWVGFVEAGRVNDEWDLDELHNDMKWTVGGGARIMVEGVIVRVDIGVSEEDAGLQMFIGQTF
ncbi:MAG: hypothetical protein KZQ64_03940 [gamma proteobacterium symbiont of Bathyaustriella thionipta]|nr:hypothetical protein [gamma proteobacterium symbiont of Bathyaustriella thionipta]MCU7950637.1 hypothetical protein [gamma proteobacterium symbiont of Bathyaustriella thionipta]MCU7952531.1 hypothetical protein [gamma proteobacterium symbiont of Bathyaustriella thionipta]MCU7957164.1 hypothetical protein [gamma proteobacterium symbiont of Bathyaustriella thionipta]MCU7967101.1 hypothetical protein [gamma proteobacterium symbiont of Bathyaustriella thionipta]